MEIQPPQYSQLIGQIGSLLASGREKAALQVNTISTNLLGNWKIHCRI